MSVSYPPIAMPIPAIVSGILQMFFFATQLDDDLRHKCHHYLHCFHFFFLHLSRSPCPSECRIHDFRKKKKMIDLSLCIFNTHDAIVQLTKYLCCNWCQVITTAEILHPMLKILFDNTRKALKFIFSNEYSAREEAE